MTSMTTSVSEPPIWKPTLPPSIRTVAGADHPDAPLLRQDLDDNATLYGRKLENREIVTKGIRPPRAAAKLMALLNKYSFRERKG